jgi:hypothetical protein
MQGAMEVSVLGCEREGLTFTLDADGFLCHVGAYSVVAGWTWDLRVQATTVANAGAFKMAGALAAASRQTLLCQPAIARIERQLRSTLQNARDRLDSVYKKQRWIDNWEVTWGEIEALDAIMALQTIAGWAVGGVTDPLLSFLGEAGTILRWLQHNTLDALVTVDRVEFQVDLSHRVEEPLELTMTGTYMGSPHPWHKTVNIVLLNPVGMLPPLVHQLTGW